MRATVAPNCPPPFLEAFKSDFNFLLLQKSHMFMVEKFKSTGKKNPNPNKKKKERKKYKTTRITLLGKF